MREAVQRISILMSALAALACSCLADEWPTYMHDPARSGVTPEEVRPPLSER